MTIWVDLHVIECLGAKVPFLGSYIYGSLIAPCPLRWQLLGSDGSSGDTGQWSLVSGHGVELCSGGASRAGEALDRGTVSVLCASKL